MKRFQAMLVYRTDDEIRDCGRELSGLIRRAAAVGPSIDPEGALALLVDVGETESGVADRLFPDTDAVHPVADAMRGASVAAASLLLDRAPEAARAVERHLQQAVELGVPETIEVGVPEGYVFYGLQPESYAAAATEFFRELRPADVVCLGIRSIGTSLSAIVAAALTKAGARVRSFTLRPRGHPFDRRVQLDERLRESLLRDRGAWFAIVDEGPGLSGSSFASIANALVDLGADADRIVLFPSWNPEGSAFKSDAARQAWQRHRRYSVNGLDIGYSPVEIARAEGEEAHDWSAGAWRRDVLGTEDEWPAVHPQHERQKLWLPGRGEVVRFVGLGKYGAARRARAEALAGAGLGPSPRWLRRGLMALDYVDGRPCRASDLSEPLIDAIADHCAFLAADFPAPRRPTADKLLEMVSCNVHEATGRTVDLARYREVLDAAPAAAIDGRMLAHDWLKTDTGYLKVDGLDHHADHFFPGTQDAAWDLAGAVIEFEMGPDAQARLIARYIARTKDGDAGRRMPFYRLAHVAFRLGYCTMASETLGSSADGLRFSREAVRYRRLLTPNVP